MTPETGSGPAKATAASRGPQPAGQGAQIRRLPVQRSPRAGRPAACPHGGTGSGIVVAPPRYALAHALTRSLGQPLVSGNRIELLRTGEAAWARLFKAIDRAREHINLESPAFIAPALAASLAQRLIARAAVGVRVNLLLDGSTRGGSRDTALLRQSGIGVCRSAWWVRTRRLLVGTARRRTQRSLIVIDGCMAFLGGLAPPNSPNARSCLCIEGPAVALLQDLFIAHWHRESGSAPPQARYFPALDMRGTQRTALAACGSGRQARPLESALRAAIDAAQISVLIDAPEPTLARALMRAAERGVEVHVLLPATARHGEGPIERARYHALLRSGVRLHRRRLAPLQDDSCVIDGVWANAGPLPDHDGRLHGTEPALIVLDGEFAAGIERRLRDDIVLCRELSARDTDLEAADTATANGSRSSNAWWRASQWLSDR